MKNCNSKVVTLVTVCLLFAGHSSAVAKSNETVNTPIQFTSPSALTCGGTTAWSKLGEWKGENGKCGSGLLYTVIGKTNNVENGYIKANIIVPENNNKVWSAFDGETHEILNNRFEVKFCITSKLATRPLLFQTYTGDGKKNGSQCTVTLVGVQLED